MTTRKTRDVRRDEILDAALDEFAELGLHGASTEDIARRAGISQPYARAGDRARTGGRPRLGAAE